MTPEQLQDFREWADDHLAVTADASGRRWICCARCVGSGMMRQPVLKAGQWVGMREVRCPDCNGEGKVEVP